MTPPRRNFRIGPVARRLLERAPLALFLLALAVGLIAYGIAIERYGIFPKAIIDDAARTGRATAESAQVRDTGRFREFSDTPLAGFPARRIEIAAGDALGDAMLIYGGRHQFRELCPEHGCLAVAVGPSGDVIHAWPFRPSAIHAANVADEDEYPYEENGFSAERDMRLARLAQYPNGDLLAVFHLRNAFPYAGGVARIDRDGHPRWFRRDYSHHHPLITEGDVAFVASLAIGDDILEVPDGERTHTYRCDGKVYRSALNVLDGDGALLERIPVLDALLASPWSGIVADPEDPCDPLHLNSVGIVGGNAVGDAGLAPGDVVLSLRQINAFAILDGETRALKRLARGSFFRQHDVVHLGGSAFLMLDNRGVERTLGVSRLLMVDLATGTETAIFPNERTPEALRGLFTHFHGDIAVSPDGRRATASFPEEGVTVEVRLADGEALAVFRSLHDVSGLDQFPDERLGRAAIFTQQGVDYLRAAPPEP